MEIEFGTLEFDREEETAQQPKLQQILSNYFGKRKLKNYTSVFLSNPHQALSDDYEPSDVNKSRLEVYFYSAPSIVSADVTRLSNISVNGSAIGLQNGQSDSISVKKLPKNFFTITDENGFQLAIALNNKVWILNDLLHNVTEAPASEDTMKRILDFVFDTYLDPPTPEELRKRTLDKMDSIIKNNFNRAKGQLESEVKNATGELQAQETRIGELIRLLAYKSDMLNIANQRKAPKGEDILQKIERMPYVKNVTFRNNNLFVETNPITIGPLEYGVWSIGLEPDSPRYTNPVFPKVRHPYQYSEGNFCMGGFQNEYVMKVSSGDFDRALTLARLEITNYSTSTKMMPVEDFLKETMGRAKFEKHIESVKEEHFPKADGVMISTIIGSKVCYVASIRASDGHQVPSVERFEINYAE
jgi:hypothetical protein